MEMPRRRGSRVFSLLVPWSLFLGISVCLLPTEATGTSKRVVGDPSTIPILEPRYYDQHINHFNHENTQTFKQKYFLYDAYVAGEASPLLFYCGAETTVLSSYTATNLSLAYFAQQLGALVVSAEHRFFGESLPFGNQSFTPSNIQYLDIQQTLMDYVSIINFIKATVPGMSKSKVIVFGGSYGGHLSMLMRLHHPGVVSGSIASAAATCTYGNVPGSTWYDLVSTSYDATVIRNGDDVIACGEETVYAFSHLWDCIHNTSCRARMQQDFHLCTSVASVTDGYYFMFFARNVFSIATQFNYPIVWPPTNLANPLIQVCQPAEAVERVLFALNMVYNATRTTPCFTYNGGTTDTPASSQTPPLGGQQLHADQLHPGGISDPVGIQRKPFSYIVCVDFPQPIGGTGIFSVPSPVNLTAVQQRCLQEWDVEPSPYRWKLFVQEPLLRDSSNIAFINAGYDPVRGFSPDHSLSSGAVVLSAMMGHTYDLFYPLAGDPADVVAVRARELELMKLWIAGSGAGHKRDLTPPIAADTIQTLCAHQSS